MSTMAERKKPILAVAIDFGTTYSGLTYMRVKSNEHMTHLDTWPGATGKFNKIPTILSYEQVADGKSVVWEPSAFGFAAESAPETQRCAMFKMCLDGDDSNAVPQPWETWIKMGKSVEDVVKDFLQMLYLHMIATFRREGLGDQHFLYSVVFTVPAQFETTEVERFKRIVRLTGFGKHEVKVSLREPEAATLFTISMVHEGLMPRGKCIVLCDAGGGTVDIASYKVAEVLPRVKLDQVNIVSGKPCGSSLIDKAFKAFFFNECLETDLDRDFYRSPEGRTHLQRMCKSFVERKEVFDNKPISPKVSFQVSPPEMKGKGIIGGYLSIPSEKMCELFADSVSGTLECLKDHVQKCIDNGLEIKSIFLVGGLGSSEYLYEKVLAYGNRLGGDIEVVKPKDAEYAVVRGAMESQYRRLLDQEDPISSRICPASYGLRVSVEWDDEIHDPNLDYKFVNAYTKQAMAANQVEWLIKKGDKMAESQVLKERFFHRRFEKNPEIWMDTIVMCTLDNPPNRITKDVRPVCNLKSDMTSIPINMFEKHKSPPKSWMKRGKAFYFCSFEIIAKIGATEIEFELHHNGKQRNDYLTASWGEYMVEQPVAPPAANNSNQADLRHEKPKPVQQKAKGGWLSVPKITLGIPRST